jgi:hypothetical protein
MCVVSAVMDYGHKQWPGLVPEPWVNPMIPLTPPGATPFRPEDFIKLVKPEKDEGRLPTKTEIEAFLRLVEAAEKFDKIAQQPHCEDPEKIKLLRAIEERLERMEKRLVEQAEKDAAAYAPPMILGSSNLPSHLTIGGAQVQLGTIVARAHKDSDLSAEAWNNLDETEREHRLVDAIAVLRKEAEAADLKDKLARSILPAIKREVSRTTTIRRHDARPFLADPLEGIDRK